MLFPSSIPFYEAVSRTDDEQASLIIHEGKNDLQNDLQNIHDIPLMMASRKIWENLAAESRQNHLLAKYRQRKKV